MQYLQLTFFLSCMVCSYSSSTHETQSLPQCLARKKNRLCRKKFSYCLANTKAECDSFTHICDDGDPDSKLWLQIQKDSCPYYDTSTQRVVAEPCSSYQNCNLVYQSYDVLEKNPLCYENTQRKCSHMKDTTVTKMAEDVTREGNEDTDSSGATATILIVILLIIFLFAIIIFLYFKRRGEILKCIHQLRERIVVQEMPNVPENVPPATELSIRPPNAEQVEQSTEEDQSMKLKRLKNLKLETFRKLENYLIQILKNELQIKELKEKTIVHWKSLTEHFNEQVPTDLEKICHHEDYHNFDVSLVYTLLTNFCMNNKPPPRGWGYYPSPDDHSIQADIERVCSLWNKMCDNDLNEVGKVEDISERMIKRGYENINENYIEEGDEERKKILHVNLNAECIVEDGIVITQGIKKTLQILKDFDIAICRGGIGCGKTTAMKYISKRYENEGWSVIFEEEQVTQPDTAGESQKILVCCDNAFGRYNFSSPRRECLSLMVKVLEGTYKPTLDNRSIKILLLIHQHVYDELQELVPFRILQNKNITVDMDNFSRAEMFLIFKEQMKTGHCDKIPKCWFRNVDFENLEEMLKVTTGLVANPTVTLIYTNIHELFSDDSFSRLPLPALKRHFIKMKTEEPELYFILLYILFVEDYRLGDDVREWAGSLHYSLTKENIEKNISKLHCYVRRDGDSVEIKHDVMYIGIFHACVRDIEDLSSLLKFCRFAKCLQFLRPSHLMNSINEFSVLFPNVEKEDKYSMVVKHFAKRIAHDEEFYSLIQEHPLMTDQYLSSKVKLYHDIKPKITIGMKTLYVKK